MDLTLEGWRKMADADREAAAVRLSSALPAPFRYEGLDESPLRAARFSHGEAGFVLVPGGESLLGFDLDQPIALTPEQWSSWASTQDEFGVDLAEFLKPSMTPLRRPVLRPYLMEREACEWGGEPYPLEKLQQEHPRGGGTVEYSRGDEVIRVVREGDRKRAIRFPLLGRRAAAEAVAKGGFRAPTSDEWEHACRAGARTLFWWGDGCPATDYPAETSWRTHLIPNPLGLKIAQNPYDWEICSEPRVFRGGDGGSMICGGAGFFAGWLPLACSWLDEGGASWEEEPLPSPIRVRRVYPL